MEPRYGFWRRVGRAVYLRLIVPLMRSRHPPEFAARGVMVGLFWAFTPLVGIQLYLVFMTWLALRWHPRWGFSLIVAMAWVWVSNVFTVLPIYYGFYVTGQLMLGDPGAAMAYDKFVADWQSTWTGDAGWAQKFYAYVKIVAHEQGLPMAIGCVPWAFGSGWLGYRWSLKFIRVRRARRIRRIRRLRRARPIRAIDRRATG